MVALRTPHKRGRRLGLVAVAAMVGALALSAPGASGAGGGPQATVDPNAPLARTLLSKAPIDECYNPNSSEVSYPDSKGKCAAGQTKVSGAYLWGQTKLGNNIWFGTAANYLCMVLAQEFMALGMAPEPVKTDQLVCEYGSGAYYQKNPTGNTQLTAYEGDWRPPHIYRYDTVTGTVKDMTPEDKTLVNITEGFRAAGSVGNTVFLAGPVVAQAYPGATTGVTIFAFNNTSGALIGSVHIPEFTNIRSFLTVGDSLYAGLMTPTGGKIARWVGTPDAPFAGDNNGFEFVGTIPTGQGGPAELAYHQGHLVATTWNMTFASGGESEGSAVFMSPTTHPEGTPFTSADDVEAWTQIWSPAMYEPDPLIRGTYMGGALASYGDYLYFGTLHGVESGAMVNIMARQQPGQTLSAQEIATALVEGNRATSIWRVRLDTTPPTPELLYGESTLPAYDYQGTAGWTNQPTGWTPKWGASGFGNAFNAYSWSMKVFQNQLYVGTFDWSYLLAKGGPVLASMLGVPADTVAIIAELLTAGTESQYGADLARFPAVDQPALLEDQTGIGDQLNYGVRTMTADDTNLYIGTANPANLATSKSQPLGGWQLIQLAPKPKKTK